MGRIACNERFEFLGEYNGFTLADDYAHHPNELQVTLEAVMKMGYKTVFWSLAYVDWYEEKQPTKEEAFDNSNYFSVATDIHYSYM